MFSNQRTYASAGSKGTPATGGQWSSPSTPGQRSSPSTPARANQMVSPARSTTPKSLNAPKSGKSTPTAGKSTPKERRDKSTPTASGPLTVVKYELGPDDPPPYGDLRYGNVYWDARHSAVGDLPFDWYMGYDRLAGILRLRLLPVSEMPE